MLPIRTCRYFAVALFLLAGVASGDESPPTITVTGSAEVRVSPDQVTLRIGVESRAEELSHAAEINSANVAAVVAFLRSEDIPERNVQTTSIRITPIYKRKAAASAQKQNRDPFDPNPSPASDAEADAESKACSYIVERQLSITINQIDRFERIYQKLIDRGVNKFESIAFSTTELRKHRERARIHAVRAAKAKAESLAGELGAQLAGVQLIAEVGSGADGHNQNVSFDDPFGVPSDGDNRVASGEIEIRAAVRVIFLLESTEFE